MLGPLSSAPAALRGNVVGKGGCPGKGRLVGLGLAEAAAGGGLSLDRDKLGRLRCISPRAGAQGSRVCEGDVGEKILGGFNTPRRRNVQPYKNRHVANLGPPVSAHSLR